jgi:hypothetical protein
MFEFLKKATILYYNKVGKYSTGWETVATMDVYDTIPYKRYEFNLLPENSIMSTMTINEPPSDSLSGKKRKLEDTIGDENTNKIAKI